MSGFRLGRQRQNDPLESLPAAFRQLLLYLWLCGLSGKLIFLPLHKMVLRGSVEGWGLCGTGLSLREDTLAKIRDSWLGRASTVLCKSQDRSLVQPGGKSSPDMNCKENETLIFLSAGVLCTPGTLLISLS